MGSGYFQSLGKDLSIVVQSINDVTFSTGMNLESTNLTNILIEITGDEVSSITFNVTYPNGSLIQNSSTESISLSNEVLNIDGIYNISIVAFDDEGNPTTLKDYFVLNDTTAPVIFWFSPLKNNLSVFNYGYDIQLNFSIYDINLFAYNISVFFPDGSTAKTIENVGSTGQGLINISDSINASILGNWTISIEATDSHHRRGKQKVIDWNVVKDQNTLWYNDCIEIEFENAEEVNTQQFDYFYDFGVVWPDDTEARKIKIKSHCSDITYLGDSDGYKNHFVVYGGAVRIWLDFMGVEEVPIVEDTGNNTYLLTYYSLPKETRFNSIGVLNTVLEWASFEVVAVPIMVDNVTIDCLTNIAPAFENRMAWLCMLNTTRTNRFECNTYVEIDGKTIQVNPAREVIELYGITQTFKEKKGLINAYFTSENLRVSPEHIYDFIIKCSHNSTTISFNQSVKPDYVAPLVLTDRILWAKDNSTYIVGGFIIIMILLLLGSMWFNWVINNK